MIQSDFLITGAGPAGTERCVFGRGCGACENISYAYIPVPFRFSVFAVRRSCPRAGPDRERTAALLEAMRLSYERREDPNYTSWARINIRAPRAELIRALKNSPQGIVDTEPTILRRRGPDGNRRPVGRGLLRGQQQQHCCAARYPEQSHSSNISRSSDKYTP